MISKSLSTSQKFAKLLEHGGKLGEFCQSLYPLLVAHADDFGRLQGDTFSVKHVCHPASSRSLKEFEQALGLLSGVGLIQCYVVDRITAIQIVGFELHQGGLHKRTASRFSEPPGNSGKFPEIPSELNRTEQNRTEGKGTEQEQPHAASALRARFETFWSNYPKKVGKDAAWKAWEKRRPTEETLQCMLLTLEWQRRSTSWLKDGGQFVPHPATWIAQGREQDSPLELGSGYSETALHNLAASDEAERIILEHDAQRTETHGTRR